VQHGVEKEIEIGWIEKAAWVLFAVVVAAGTVEGVVYWGARQWARLEGSDLDVGAVLYVCGALAGLAVMGLPWLLVIWLIARLVRG